jgi:Zn-finger nucleic acid-binding protein
MPRCPVCGSSVVTIVVSLHPHAFCSTCGARWIQDGSEQRAIGRVQEPAFMAPAPTHRKAGNRAVAGLGGPRCVSW